jgi:hypothetical protein
MTTTVDISTIGHARSGAVDDRHAVPARVAALRIIDSAAPAPANPHVRRRLRYEHGGIVDIGMVRAEVDATA